MTSAGTCIADHWRESRPKIADVRVLHFLCTPIRAGVGEHALSLLVALREHGFVPYIAAPAPLLESASKELDQFEIRNLAMDMSSPLDWREIWRLSSYLRRERIDIVHCHMSIASFCAAPVARLSSVPIVIETAHGREVWREGKPIKGTYWFDKQVGRLVDKFIAVSDAVAWHLRGNKRIPRSKIITIRNGRDLSEFQPPTQMQVAQARAALHLKDEPVVLMVARFSPEKGHLLLIDAARLLKPRWPSLVVLLVGDGPLESEVKARCEQYGLTGNVRFMGYRTGVQDLLAAADVVALPSKVEGLPLVAIEALAAARAVVATAVGGTPEIVVNGETGLLVPPDSPARFADALHRCLSDPALRDRLGAQGRKLVEERFDVRTQITETTNLYWELLSAAPFSRRSQSNVGAV
jgi:glycosyltransferase involved in cell wall biosynthesis